MAILLDGSDDHIDMGDVCNITGALTISAWVYREAADATESRIVNKWGSSQSYLFAVMDDNQLRGYIDDGSFNGGDTTGTISDDTWVHIVMTYSSGNGDIYCFINGSGELVNSTGDGTIVDSAAAFRIGASSDGTPANLHDGMITEVAIWNVVLSQAEIDLLGDSRIKYLPLQIQPANLQGYWPLDDFADGATASGANTIIDRSGNGNHGTPTNSPTGRAEEVLSYPVWPQVIHAEDAAVSEIASQRLKIGVGR